MDPETLKAPEHPSGSETPAEAPKRKRLGKADLEQRRPRAKELVYLPDHDGEVEIQELRPGDMAEINAKCIVQKPHPDPKRAAAGEKQTDWDGRKRTAYMIAKALLNEKGHPLYPGENFIYGAEIILGEYSLREQEILTEAVQRVSRLDKEGREAAGKD